MSVYKKDVSDSLEKRTHLCHEKQLTLEGLCISFQTEPAHLAWLIDGFTGAALAFGRGYEGWLPHQSRRLRELPGQLPVFLQEAHLRRA
jgi:hypothetical protein